MPNHAQGEGKTKVITIRVYQGDIELIEWLADYFGSSKSDAVRTAVRSTAIPLKKAEGAK